MKQFQANLLRDLKPTIWGHDGACPGPIAEVRNGEPVLVKWANELPKPEVRTVVHLYGGRHGPESNGYPEE